MCIRSINWIQSLSYEPQTAQNRFKHGHLLSGYCKFFQQNAAQFGKTNNAPAPLHRQFAVKRGQLTLI